MTDQELNEFDSWVHKTCEEHGVEMSGVFYDELKLKVEDVVSHHDKQLLDKVNRVEVIDWTREDGISRCFVKWDDNIKVEQHLQDDGRTLKIFISAVQERLRK